MSRRSVSPGRELARDDRAAGVDEREALALELLQDEALAAEQAGADLLVPARCRPRCPWPRTGTRPSGTAACRRAARRSIGMILPGYGAANATLLARLRRRCRRSVMNSDSPVSTRLAPAEQLAHEALLLRLREPSPKIVSISMPGSM